MQVHHYINNKTDLIGCSKTYLDGFDYRYYITLNSAQSVQDRSDISRLIPKYYDKVVVCIDWLKKYCYGTGDKKVLMRGVMSPEVAFRSNLLHFHIMVAGKTEPKRSTEEMSNFLYEKWQRFRGRKILTVKSNAPDLFRGSSVHVRKVDSEERAIGYSNKLSGEWLYQDENRGFYPL
jgi:hypothetical protein